MRFFNSDKDLKVEHKVEQSVELFHSVPGYSDSTITHILESIPGSRVRESKRMPKNWVEVFVNSDCLHPYVETPVNRWDRERDPVKKKRLFKEMLLRKP